MTEKLADRRIGRTRRLLKEALLGLIRERPYSSITVEQITERADVGRSTFYSHFTSKDALLLDGFDRYLNALAQPLAGPDTSNSSPGATASLAGGFRFSLPLLRHIRSQRKFFLATIFGASEAHLRSKVVALFVEMVRLELELGAETSTAGETAARTHAIAGAFLEIAAWWLERSPDQSAEFVDRVFNRAVRSG